MTHTEQRALAAAVVATHACLREKHLLAVRACLQGVANVTERMLLLLWLADFHARQLPVQSVA